MSTNNTFIFWKLTKHVKCIKALQLYHLPPQEEITYSKQEVNFCLWKYITSITFESDFASQGTANIYFLSYWYLWDLTHWVINKKKKTKTQNISL